jgi:CHAT domain-containing protein/tetratricopeptide (TPR) repeat protein
MKAQLRFNLVDGPHKSRVRGFCLVLLIYSGVIYAPSLVSAKNDEQDAAGKAAFPKQLATDLLGPGKSQEFEVALTAGQHLRARVIKKDFNLLVTIYGPDREPAAEFVSRRYGPLSLSYYASQSGRHRIAVRSLENREEAQPYELWIDALEVASDHDLKVISAIKAYAQAESLRAEWKEGSLQLAVQEYVKAAERWRALGRGREEAEALLGAGEACFILNQTGKAQGFYDRALGINQADGDRRAQIDALNHLGQISLYLSAPQRAKELSEKVLGFYEPPSSSATDDDLRRKAQAFSNLGEVSYSSGDLKKALELFAQAFDLWSRAKDRAGVALAEVNMGYAHLDLGNMPEARTHFEKALAIFQQIDDRQGVAQSLNAIGGIYSFLGEKQKALNLFNQARQQVRACGDLRTEDVALNWMGKVYEDLNNPGSAVASYQAALVICQQLQDLDCEAVTQYYLGRAWRQAGEAKQALVHYERSLSLSRQNGKRRLEAYNLKDLAILHAASGDIQKALDQYEKVLRVYEETEDRRGQAYTLISLGDIDCQLKHLPAALDKYQRALERIQSSQDRTGEVLALYRLARAEWQLSKHREALSHIERSIELIESLRTKIAGQEFRMSYFASVVEHYKLYIDLLMHSYRQKRSEETLMAAFKASERARARVLLEMFNEANLEIYEGVDPFLLERERYYARAIKAKIDRGIRLLSHTGAESEAAELEKEIELLSREYQGVYAQIKASNPQYAALKQPALLEVKDIQQQALDADTILLEYSLGEERSFLWVITKTSLNYFELPKRRDIEAVARRMYDDLTARHVRKKDETWQQRSQRIQDADREYPATAAKLSEMILGPALPLLREARLVIVADGVLRYIPFAALPISGGSRHKTQPLLVDHEIIYLPSASLITVLRSQTARRIPARGLLAILTDPVFDENDVRVSLPGNRPAAQGKDGAEPQAGSAGGLGQALRDVRLGEGGTLPRLLYSKQEGEEIMKLVPGGIGMLATGFAANKALSLSPQLGEYRIVHFATHGLIDDKHPELSGIVLSLVDEQGKPQDGFLRLQEMYNLKLSADLVVLSACGTGLGEEIQGEGLIGLTRGFMYAGAARVMASLWNITDEAAAQFMKRFYTGLLKNGMTAAAALRAAQLDMWKSKDWAEPNRWAAFIIEGEWR